MGSAALVVAPFSVVAYVPKCFFGALLVLIATDLMYEWLWAARRKMTRAEFAVALATFGAIQAFGVEFGMGAGVVVAMVV